MNPNRLPSFSTLPAVAHGFSADTVYSKVEAKNARFEIFYSPESDRIAVYNTKGRIYSETFSDEPLIGIEFSPETAERLVKLLNRLFAGKGVTKSRFFKVVYNARFDLAF